MSTSGPPLRPVRGRAGEKKKKTQKKSGGGGEKPNWVFASKFPGNPSPLFPGPPPPPVGPWRLDGARAVPTCSPPGSAAQLPRGGEITGTSVQEAVPPGAGAGNPAPPPPGPCEVIVAGSRVRSPTGRGGTGLLSPTAPVRVNHPPQSACPPHPPGGLVEESSSWIPRPPAPLCHPRGGGGTGPPWPGGLPGEWRWGRETPSSTMATPCPRPRRARAGRRLHGLDRRSWVSALLRGMGGSGWRLLWTGNRVKPGLRVRHGPGAGQRWTWPQVSPGWRSSRGRAPPHGSGNVGGGHQRGEPPE